MTADEAAWLLEEWARWARGEVIHVGWPPATAFGRLIKPDPMPSRLPIDVQRAERTERVVAKLPGRYRFLVKLAYLDSAPLDAKARRMRLSRDGYRRLVEGVNAVVALRLQETSKCAKSPQTAQIA